MTNILPLLTIGTADESRKITNDEFRAILNVAIDVDIEDNFKWRHRVGLLDGYGNCPLLFISAVITLHSLLMSGKRTFIHCQAGTSRSVMVTSCYISIIKDILLMDVLQKIMKERNIDVYRPELLELAQKTIPIIKTIISSNN